MWDGGAQILSQDENDIADCINRLDMDEGKKNKNFVWIKVLNSCNEWNDEK